MKNKKALLVLAFSFGTMLGLASCGEEAVSSPLVNTKTFTYNGAEISLGISSTSAYSVVGEKATNVGKYTATITLNDGYTWADKSSEPVSISWEILPKAIEKPSLQKANFEYTGKDVEVSVSNTQECVISGNVGKNAGSYKAKVALKDKTNYTWLDGTTDDLSYDWTISKAKVEKPALEEASLVYSGQEQSINLAKANELVSLTNNAYTNAGDYVANVSLKDKDNYTWADGTSADLKLTWSIAASKVDIPTLASNNLTYTGEEQQVSLSEESSLYTLANNKATTKGAYKAVVSLVDKVNYTWADGTTEDKELGYSVGLKQISKPTLASSSLVYNGEDQSVSLSEASSEYSLSNNTGKNAGSYTAKVVLTDKENTCWTDGTTDDVDLSFAIGKAKVEAPTITETSFVYNGNEQGISVDSELYALSDNKATNAGTYQAYLSLVDEDNYTWADGTVADIEVEFVIAKKEVEAPKAFETTSFVFNGNEQGLEFTANSDYQVSANTATNAGSYKAIVTLADKANLIWKDSDEKDLEYAYEITKASVTVPTNPNTLEFTYDGNEKEVAYTANALYSVTGNKQTDAGEYEVVITLTDTANYAWSESSYTGKVSWKINKADYDLTGITFAETTKTYNGDEYVFELSNVPSGVQVTYKDNKLTNAGSLEAEARFTVSKNYNESVIKATITVNKVTPVITAKDVSTTYSGNEVTGDATSTFGDVSYVYCTDKNNPTTSTIASADVKNAGTYYYKAKVAGTANINAAESNEWKQIAIAKAAFDADISAISFNSTRFENDGNAHSLQISGSLPSGVSVSYSSNNSLTANGKVTVVATFTIDGNHEVATKEATLEVYEKTIITVSNYSELQSALGTYNPTTDAQYSTWGDTIIKLSANIDCGGNAWTPVGSLSSYTRFNGELDGAGYSITNFVINNTSTDLLNVGFFSALGGNAYIHDVTINGTISLNYANGASSSTQVRYIGMIAGMVASENVSIKNVSVTPTVSINNRSAVSHTVFYGGAIGFDQTSSKDRDNIDVKSQNVSIYENASVYGLGGLVGFLSSNGSVNTVYKNCDVSGGVIDVVSLPKEQGKAVMGAYIGTIGNAPKLVFDTCTSSVTLNSYDSRTGSGDIADSFPTATAGETLKYAYDSKPTAVNTVSYELPSAFVVFSTSGANLFGWFGNQVATSNSSYVGTKYSKLPTVLSGTTFNSVNSTCTAKLYSRPTIQIDIFVTAAQLEAGYNLDSNYLYNGTTLSDVTWFKEQNVYAINNIKAGWDCGTSNFISTTGKVIQPYFTFSNKIYDVAYLNNSLGNAYCVMNSGLFYRPNDGTWSDTSTGTYAAAFPVAAYSQITTTQLTSEGSAMVVYGLVTVKGKGNATWETVIQLYIERQG